MFWTSEIFWTTDDCDRLIDVVYELVSSVRERRLKLVLEGETIKSHLKRFANLIIFTKGRQFCFRSFRQGKDMI
jgi:hypothetical protein